MQRKPYDITIPYFALHSLDSNTLIYYCIIQLLCRWSEVDEYVVVPEMIWYQLHDNSVLYRETKKIIKSRLDNLVELKIIKSKNKVGYIIKPESFYCNEQYIKCPVEAFDKLKLMPDEFRHYLYILKTIYNGSGKANLPIEYYAEAEKRSRSSIIRYNKKLEDLELIFINRSKYKDGREVNSYSVDPNIKQTNIGNDSNWRRSVSARYNNYIKCPEKYDKEYAEALYKDIIKYNADCDKLAEIHPEYADRKKDVLIFNL